MNHYPHHIGDYTKDTAHLSMIEDGAYRRLIDLYYLHEQALPAERRQVYRLARATSTAERKAIDTILDEYFTVSPDGFRHSRCDEEIERYQVLNEDSEAKKENEKERQRRHRQRRKELFEALREHDIVPPWDAKTNELEALLSQCQQRPVTRDNPLPVTRTATANQYPIPNTQDIKEQATATPPPPAHVREEPPPPGPEEADRFVTPATRISVALRNWERDRGKQARWNSTHCDGIVELNPTDAELREAYDLAVEDRKNREDDSPVNPGFVATFIRKIREPKPERKASTTAWHTTEQATLAKGAEFGLSPRPGEDWPAFRSRITAAIAEAERRKSA